MKPELNVENLRVVRKGNTLLDALNLKVGLGELVAVLGPSGAGKSTLLRAIAGLQRPLGGTISIDGENITHTPPGGRGAAMVMDRPALFEHMTVEENIAFAVNKELRDSTPKEQVQVALTMLSIRELAHRYPGELSMGQRQKVSLARVLVRRPRVLLFDEPLAHVDAYTAAQLRDEILRVHHRMNCATLYVTHDVKEAFSIADRIIYMQEGRIIQDDLPQEIHDGPASIDIARHLGATTLLSATADTKRLPSGEIIARTTVLGQTLTIVAAPTMPEGKNTPIVIVGYPDSVALEPTEQAPAFKVNADIGQILGNTYLGESYRLSVESELGSISADISAGELERVTGDQVRIRLIEELLWALPSL
ncbi:MAG: ABC transporter ATP-binding protein [Actinomycetaceae bacterium]|nr:ABC transporter ATP-binding protein [Actinomycetaceae bacterium]